MRTEESFISSDSTHKNHLAVSLREVLLKKKITKLSRKKSFKCKIFSKYRLHQLQVAMTA